LRADETACIVRAVFTLEGSMKLYFSPGSCSLSPHIILRELGAPFELEQVDLREKKTKAGADFWQVNGKGQAPTLVLDDGSVLTENAAIAQYLADKYPAAGLAPPAGTMERYRLQEWLSFVGSELHKTFGPMFRPTTPEEFKTLSKERLARSFAFLDKHLAGRDYLMGDTFTVADAYCFAVLRWSNRVDLDLARWPNIKAYVARVAARPKVQEVMKVEGLVQ
jgi:glutathione S-transferase